MSLSLLKKRINNTIIVIFVLTAVLNSSVWARQTSALEAEQVVDGWLSLERRPLETELGQSVSSVETFTDANNQPIYYIVYLEPEGFVIVPADDLVEPIIGFVAAGIYDPSLANPLGALVSTDLNARMTMVRDSQRVQSKYLQQTTLRAQSKWNDLSLLADTEDLDMGLPSISDVRVVPLVQSKWSQQTECGNYCYNYYTPSHYPCGCVATAMAQVMRFHQHPATGIGVHGFSIEVDGSPQTAYTRGGDGSGGLYNWSQMVLDPGCSTTDTQRQAIGALCYDAGLSVNMSYTSGGSGADTLKTKDALVNTFNYDNARKGYNSSNNIGAGLNGMINPNLDYGNPVILGITGTSGGHAIVTDGYGYNSSTLYHHLNMGWAGSYDAWYNLPNINSSPSFSSVYKCVYNIFVSGSGEIISGRVTDISGTPISGASVVGQRSGGGTYSDTTDSSGIYALAKVPSNSSYTITATKTGCSFTPQNVTTGTSSDYGSTSGNRWEIDFVNTATTPPEAFDDSVTAQMAISKTIDLQATDDGQPPPGILTYIVTSLPSNGTLSDPCTEEDISSVPYTLANNGNQVVYTSDSEYTGPDSFQFKANDGGTAPEGGDSNVATITIDVADCMTVTIGTGTSTWDYPMHTYYHDSRTQVIYLASEIVASGTISDLALDVDTVPGQTMNNWTIRMKHTSMDFYSSASFDDTGWVVVYQGNEPTGITGWRTFTFSTTFAYNGTDNLLIDFSHNNSSYTSSGRCRYSGAGVNRSAYAYTDSGYGDPLTWSGTTLPTVYGSTYVPNVKLTLCGGSVVTQPPVAEDVNVSTSLNTQVAITLQASDDGYPNPPGILTYTIISLPIYGDLNDPCAGPITDPCTSLANNGSKVEYIPGIDYEGQDSFTFIADDNGVPPEGGDSNEATVSINVTACIFFDDFPSTTLDTNNWTEASGTPTVDGLAGNEPSPPYSLHLEATDSVTSRVVDLYECWSAQLHYWWKRVSTELADDLYVDYWDGNEWQPLQVLLGGANTSWGPNSVELPDDALHSEFRLRFWADCDSTSDEWYIDDVCIQCRYCADPPVLHDEPNKTQGCCNTIYWEPVDEANEYYAERAEDVNFNNIDANSGWITDTSYEFCGLTPDQTYWYHVKAWAPFSLKTWLQTTQVDFETDALTDTRATADGNVVLAGGGGTIFQDDFEDGNYDGWIHGSSSCTREVVDDTAAAGTTYSFTQVGSASHRQGVYHTLPSVTPDRVVFYVRTASTNASGYVVLDGNSSFECAVFFYMSGGLIKVYSGETYSTPCELLTWYKIEFVFHWPTKQIDFYVDDILVADSIPFRDSATSYLNTIHLYNLYDVQAWWDEIEFSTGSGGGYTPIGDIVSIEIDLPADGNWVVVDFNTTTPTDTELTVDILPAAGSTPIAGYENVSSGADLSGIGVPTIRLRANLSTTDANNTPVLHDWSVSYTDPAFACESDWSNVESSLQCATPGDFEPDCDVDWADLAVLVDQWLQPPGTPSADIAPAPDGDGTVNFLDFAVFAENWLAGVE